jgi:hypothetical protein
VHKIIREVTASRSIPPKGATHYDLLAMSDQDFETMVARLIKLEQPNAFKPANVRDGGADMVLPDGTGGYSRCWQSKHYPDQIHWSKCDKSLAAAEAEWNPRHYTFCFPRELTVTEQKTFDKHFRGDGAKLRVDHWNGDAIQSLLIGSPEGQRVAATFFEDAALDRERTYQAIEAGGRIDTAEEVLDRLSNLGGVLAAKDAFFSYPASTHEAQGPAPSLAPGTVISLATSDGTVASRIDAVPRDAEAMSRYGPEFALKATEGEEGKAAAERLENALRAGEPAEITGGLDLTFTRLPPGLADLEGRTITGGTIRLGAPVPVSVPIPPWDAEFAAHSDAGAGSVRLMLRPTDSAPEGWDGALQGRRGGLTATASFRRVGEGGQINWNFNFARDASPVAEQLRTVRFLHALSGKGDVTITDRGPSRRPQESIPTRGVEPSHQLRALTALLEDLDSIERRADVKFSLPETITEHELRAIAAVAAMVRNEGADITWRDAELTMPGSSAEALRDAPPLRVEQDLGARILGQEFALGKTQVDLADYTLASITPTPEDAEFVSVRLEANAAEGNQVFERLTHAAPLPEQRLTSTRRAERRHSKGKRRPGKKRKA